MLQCTNTRGKAASGTVRPKVKPVNTTHGIGIGGSLAAPPPPTPPYVRVRIRRFGGLSAGLGAHGGQTEPPEEGRGEGKGESGAVAEPPGAMRGAGGLSR